MALQHNSDFGRKRSSNPVSVQVGLEGIKPTDKELKVDYLVVEGDPARAILKSAAERDCDLIVMGSHGRSGLKRLLFGSVAERVIRKATCPMLIVKSHVAQAAESHPVA
jgi:nucleotide-binding universal stress UspA family protein